MRATSEARARTITASDLMSQPVIAIDGGRSVWEAWVRMSRCDVRHLVVTTGERCAGVVDDRQLLASWPEGPMTMRRTPVQRLVRRATHCVLRDASIDQVAAIMTNDRTDAVPVIGCHGTVLGMITAVDIVRAVARQTLESRA